MPTKEQMYTCFCLMQNLSNAFCSIEIFRYDRKRDRVYILAVTARDEEIQIEVYKTGKYNFIDDQTRL